MEERLARLEAVLGASRPDLEARIATLEAEAKTPKPRPRALEWLQVLAPIVNGVVVVLVGYLLTESVKAAISERQLEVSTGQAMSALVEKLRAPDVSREGAEAVALTLAAAYGRSAAIPLLHEIEHGGENSRPAAELGLRALAVGHRGSTCILLADAVDNRTGLHGWPVHLAAIRLLGEMNCQDASTTLARYCTLVGAPAGPVPDERLARFRSAVAEEPEPDAEAVRDVATALEQSLKRLRRQGCRPIAAQPAAPATRAPSP